MSESYNSIAPHLWNLRLTGYYQIDPSSPKNYKLAHRIYMRFALFLIIFYTIQQVLKVYEVRNDMGQIMETLFLFLTHTDSIYKQIILWLREDKVEYLLHILRVATCFLWIVYPLILHIQGKHIEFPIWLPYDENADPFFYITAIYVWIITSWLALGNTSMDVMISTLLAQAKTHWLKLTDISINLHERFTKVIADIFGTVLAYQFLIAAWIICTSVYRMDDSMKLADFAYAMDWTDVPINQRRSLIIFMERVKCPIIFVAGRIIPLSNNTFVSMKTSLYLLLST
ncbi:unnamed protein product [Leptidea sinapis]|uniref:Odorant receptor n=1 Tax=Leptidea sinapis TaxID=189913 RepID=A0A5E4Q4F4_9NEOP|nr:unnamed protein product [Leptidea sinapis]